MKINTLNKIIFFTVIAAFLSLLVFSSISVQAASHSYDCNGLDTVFGCVPKDEKALQHLIAIMYAWVASIIGSVSVLGLIYAAFTYVTSGGNPDNIMKAKSIIWSSIAALLIVAFSWGLFNLLGIKL